MDNEQALPAEKNKDRPQSRPTTNAAGKTVSRGTPGSSDGVQNLKTQNGTGQSVNSRAQSADSTAQSSEGVRKVSRDTNRTAQSAEDAYKVSQSAHKASQSAQSGAKEAQSISQGAQSVSQGARENAQVREEISEKSVWDEKSGVTSVQGESSGVSSDAGGKLTEPAQKKHSGKKKKVVSQPERKLSVRISQKDYDRIAYWTDRENVSKSTFVLDAIDHYIGFLNHDFDVPSAMVARLNQLIDCIEMLASNQESLESVIIDGFDSIMGISRGANYLLDENGEL